ncbi:MAG: hypothetical protein DIZ80_09445 [endosymbiont of Galathealinum brachiosum]|uniref:Aromatic hydrocarbon degradation protein n=1 Tax=endosymbiont of Galathealinum brachiosum TaxID=2200906 RepID=A0A370DD48_9GAMM|nr:MAG: hypothetical protein DIZ80_09445 [endosymbiont of Galathealinum brachiosum]
MIKIQFNKVFLTISLLFVCLDSHATYIIINNYNRTPIGEAGGMQGGAYVARVQDASATWYNPAGLGSVQRNSISGNASLNEYNKSEVGTNDSVSSISATANFVGGVVRLGKGATMGWSIVVPTSFSYSGQQSINDLYNIKKNPGDPLDIREHLDVQLFSDYSNSAKFEIFSPGISFGFTAQPNLRYGFGIRAYSVDLHIQENAVTYQPAAGGVPFYNSVLNTRYDASAWLLGYELGLQWDISSKMTLGLMMRSATSSLTDTASDDGFVFTELDEDSIGLDDIPDSRFSDFTHTLNPNTDFNYKLPLSISLGLAWKEADYELELDINYYDAISPYQMLGGAESRNVQQSHLAIYNDEIFTLDGAQYETGSVVNIALGSRIRVAEDKYFNMGLFLDNAPGGLRNEVFNQMDFIGLTTGMTHVSKTASISYGLYYSQGDNPADAFNDPVTGEGINLKSELKTLSFMLATSIYF